jgi:hypothetical protein
MSARNYTKLQPYNERSTHMAPYSTTLNIPSLTISADHPTLDHSATQLDLQLPIPHCSPRPPTQTHASRQSSPISAWSSPRFSHSLSSGSGTPRKRIRGGVSSGGYNRGSRCHWACRTQGDVQGETHKDAQQDLGRRDDGQYCAWRELVFVQNPVGLPR